MPLGVANKIEAAGAGVGRIGIPTIDRPGQQNPSDGCFTL